MLIENKTSVTLDIMGKTLEPGKSREFVETMLNDLSIHSDIGSCRIVTEYCKRYIKNYGDLVAKEGRKKNENGMKNIIVTSSKAK